LFNLVTSIGYKFFVVDIRWMFRAFRIGFTITGRNYSNELQNVNSHEYEMLASEIFAHVSLVYLSKVSFVVNSIYSLKKH